MILLHPGERYHGPVTFLKGEDAAGVMVWRTRQCLGGKYQPQL